MCHFITAVIGGRTEIGGLNAIAERHHRWLDLIENSSVQPFLRSGERYFSTLPRRAMCDCGTTLGWLARQLERAPRSVSIEAHIAKLQRKGWKEAKISRWLESKERDRQTWTAPSPEEIAADTQNDNWLALAQAMLAEPAVSSFGLMVHWYRSGLENRIPVSGREEVKLSRTALASMIDCKLYVFRN